MQHRKPPKTRKGRPTQVSKVEDWLKKGRRTSILVARDKWGMSPAQYNGTIRNLRRRLDIDSDEKTIHVTLATGVKRRMTIATHQLVR